eukprot:767438-Hanusia_phi.AAC.7
MPTSSAGGNANLLPGCGAVKGGMVGFSLGQERSDAVGMKVELATSPLSSSPYLHSSSLFLIVSSPFALLTCSGISGRWDQWSLLHAGGSTPVV